MGTNAPEHWNDTPGNYSTLPTSQQCPVISTTAPLMTHVSHFYEKDTLSCFLCFISSFWHISRNRIKFLTVYSPDSNQVQRTFPYLHSCHRALCPHNQSPVLSSCPSTTAWSLPPQSMSMPFQRRAGWQKTVPSNVSFWDKSSKSLATRTTILRMNEYHARELFSLPQLPPQSTTVRSLQAALNSTTTQATIARCQKPSTRHSVTTC